MRIVVHLSDLHFGRTHLETIAPLVSAVHEIRPQLTVISGDFVQKGVRAEFEEAGEFVRMLPMPRLVVPGNHDMPFNNLARRFITGLGLYRQYISTDLEPFWKDDELAVMGVNTARRWPIRGGRINESQMERVERKLCSLGNDVTKILVTHHPFDLSDAYRRDELVGRARQAMGRFAQSIDILLAGHMHVSHAGRTGVRYQISGNSAIFVQAGTATSRRGRGEPNAFNVLRIDRPRLEVERWQWSTLRKHFECVSKEHFELAPGPEACAAGPATPAPEEVTASYGAKEERRF